MMQFLGFVSVLSYLGALIVGLGSLGGLPGGTLGFILAGIYGLCGTVAAAGSAVLYRLDKLRTPPPPA